MDWDWALRERRIKTRCSVSSSYVWAYGSINELRRSIRTGAYLEVGGMSSLSVRFSLRCLWKHPEEAVSFMSEAKGRSWGLVIIIRKSSTDQWL